MKYIDFNFSSSKIIKQPRKLKTIAYIVIFFLAFCVLFLAITPWLQTSRGPGRVLAIDPNLRIQDINSSVSGRIKKWHITEGQIVKKGELIVELEDLDPQFMTRLRTEKEAAFNKLQAIKIATETAALDYERQRSLYDKGLSSRIKFEKAKITYKKFLSEEATTAAKLLNIETKLSRQMTQEIRSPSNGQILKILYGSGNVVVNEGDKLATFLPETQKQAVEVYVSGNDLPLIVPGREVRLQFEGWPAVQVSGWPSLAIGTFGGKVVAVDPSTHKDGKIRVLISPDEKDPYPWPSVKFLRQGNRAFAWIILDEVKLGYELWRQFNGFPPEMKDPIFEEMEKIKNGNKKKKKKKDK